MPLLPDGTPFDVRVLVRVPFLAPRGAYDLPKETTCHRGHTWKQDGFAETEVGAVRSSRFGDGAVIFEKLVAVDDDKHVLCVPTSPFQQLKEEVCLAQELMAMVLMAGSGS